MLRPGHRAGAEARQVGPGELGQDRLVPFAGRSLGRYWIRNPQRGSRSPGRWLRTGAWRVHDGPRHKENVSVNGTLLAGYSIDAAQFAYDNELQKRIMHFEQAGHDDCHLVA